MSSFVISFFSNFSLHSGHINSPKSFAVKNLVTANDGIETKEYHRSCNYVTSIEGYNGDKEVHQRLCLQEIIK